MQHWAFSRGLGGILVLIDFARRHGMSLSDTLAESGITQAQLRQPNADVAATQELRVIAISSSASAIPCAWDWTWG